MKEIISEEKQSLAGVFHLGVLPTIAPYLLPRFFPQLMEKYPELDIRVTEMKTQNIQQALHAGDIDAAIIASKLEDTFLKEETLFYETFFGYVSCKEPLFKHDVIRTSDITANVSGYWTKGIASVTSLYVSARWKRSKSIRWPTIWEVWKPLCVW